MGRYNEEQGEHLREKGDRVGGRKKVNREEGEREGRKGVEDIRRHTDEDKVIKRLKKEKSKLAFIDQ